MKKLIASLFVGSCLFNPTFAHPNPNSYDAMHCMKLRECNDEVYELVAEDYTGELKKILENLRKMEVRSYEAPGKYFVEDYRALYYADKNTIFLNTEYINEDQILIEVMRHEGWHAAQDCMGGGIANSDLMSILDHNTIPSDIIKETISRYGYDPTVVRLEREAVWAMYEPWMTIEALEACNSDVPIWETYFPPKKTWSYLYWNGHLTIE